MKPLASLSMDLDNKWSYLKTHGDPSWEALPSYFGELIPLTLEALERLELSITFFVVGQDAALEGNAPALGLLTRRGHEVGNHSFSHEPWLHLFSSEQIREELRLAESHIRRVCGQKPVGFRGPGFSWSAPLLQVLAEEGYLFDASTLPTFIGPLARAWYFRSARLDDGEKERRARLFGGAREGFRPARGYLWALDSGSRLLEIPVTTMPIMKVPFHLSYLLYLSRFSRTAMDLYVEAAVGLCRLTGTTISFLLHPLDLLGGEQVPELAFFPGMDLSGEHKLRIFERVLRRLGRSFRLVNMSTHARALLDGGTLKSYPAR
jgi:hypothetical protein